jgi:hypothetical protein
MFNKLKEYSVPAIKLSSLFFFYFMIICVPNNQKIWTSFCHWSFANKINRNFENFEPDQRSDYSRAIDRYHDQKNLLNDQIFDPNKSSQFARFLIDFWWIKKIKLNGFYSIEKVVFYAIFFLYF